MLAGDPIALDFGDAPTAAQLGIAADYPVMLADDGARHAISSLRLGALVDSEADGQPDAGALGDDLAGQSDEDGVVWLTDLVVDPAGVSLAGVEVTASEPGVLDAWIDFNRDGDWNDPGEQIFASYELSGGSERLHFEVPSTASLGATAARFRVSSDGGLAPTGLAIDGEVEDYLVVLQDGAELDGVTVNAQLPGSSVSASLLQNATQTILEVGGQPILQVRTALLAGLTILGTDGDDQLLLNTPDGFGGPLSVGFSGGSDALIAVGIDQTIDLSDSGQFALPDLERIDVTSGGRVVLDPLMLASMQPTSRTLFIERGTAGKVQVNDPWAVDAAVFIDDRLYHPGTFGAGAEAVAAYVATENAWHNPFRPSDVDGDGLVRPFDALMVIGALNRAGRFRFAVEQPEVTDNTPSQFLDVNNDGLIDPVDALEVINRLNRLSRPGGGQGESQGGAPVHDSPPKQATHARLFVDLSWLDEDDDVAPYTNAEISQPRYGGIA